MASGRLTSEELTEEYIAVSCARPEWSWRERSYRTDPDALTMARNADKLRRMGHVLGPLHGIPVLVKDNVDTGR